MINPPVEIPGGTHFVRVAKLNPNQEHPEESTVSLLLIPKRPVDVADFTISTKPYVNVLWLGGYMMFLGGIIAWRRRAGIAARSREKEKEPDTAPQGDEPTPGVRPQRRRRLHPEPSTVRGFVRDEG
jgi:hypothetical protein